VISGFVSQSNIR